MIGPKQQAGLEIDYGGEGDRLERVQKDGNRG